MFSLACADVPDPAGAGFGSFNCSAEQGMSGGHPPCLTCKHCTALPCCLSAVFWSCSRLLAPRE